MANGSLQAQNDSLVGLPGVTDTFRAFVQTVRGYLRDFPELNRLVAGEESTDRQIAWSVLDALTDFNGTPPFLGPFALEDLLPDESGEVVLDGLFEGVELHTNSEVVKLGQVEEHETDTGVKVDGYHSYSVNDDLVIYSPIDLDPLINPDDVT